MDSITPDLELLAFNRNVPCACSSAMVVSRRPEKFDRFAVCSHGCFDEMLRKQTDYYEVNYGMRVNEVYG